MIHSFSESGWLLASVEHSIEFWRIWLVVNDAAFDFYPGVSFERHLLRANDHLGGHTVSLQKARCGGGSLQTERLFPIPNASHVYCGADLFDGTRTWSLLGDRTVANFVVERAEVFSR